MANILIVDDAKFIRLLLKDILSANGHNIVGEATDGSEAIMLYEQFKPDLVTMDIVMPQVSGVEAVKAIMAKDPNAKIIMISSMGQNSLVMESILEGAKDFIVKPFDEMTVIEVVNKALR